MTNYVFAVFFLAIAVLILDLIFFSNNREKLKDEVAERVKKLVTTEVEYLEQTIVKNTEDFNEHFLHTLHELFIEDINNLLSNRDKRIIEETYNDFEEYVTKLKEQAVLKLRNKQKDE